jgi:molybdate transport system substrate-binding protein
VRRLLSVLAVAVPVLAAALLLSPRRDGAGRRELTVFAASSLEEAFTKLAARFEEREPGVDVRLQLAGSSTLALQIVEGAEAGVFASADAAQVERVASAVDGYGLGRVFATSRLVVALAPGSGLRAVEDLGRPGVRLVLAGPEVPAGRYAREALAEVAAGMPGGEGWLARVQANVASEEQNVRLVAAKVAVGGADAGIVYATDAASFPGLETAAIDASVTPTYVVTDRAGDRAAERFVALLMSEEGAAVLRGYGFSPAR